MSSYEYFKIFKNTYFQEYVRTAVSVLLNILIFFFLKNEKMANRKLGKAGNLGNLGNIIPSFRFGPTAKIENSDLKFLEKISEISKISGVSEFSTWPLKALWSNATTWEFC